MCSEKTPGTCDGQPARLYPGDIRALDAPQVAVNPQDPGQVVTVFTGQGVQAGDASDAFVSSSNDKGKTWTEPQPIPPVEGVQMSPAVDISGLGLVEFVVYVNELVEGAESVDLFLAGLIMLGDTGGDLGLEFLGRQRVNAVPSSHGPQDPPFDTSATPCQGPGPIGMTQARSVFVAWTDGRDPGPAGNDGIDPNIYFAHVGTPRVPTETSVNVKKTSTKLVISGELTPSLAGDPVTVLLFRDDGDGFDRIGRKRVDVNAKHRYGTSFARPDDGRCRVVVKFAGNADALASSARRTFAC